MISGEIKMKTGKIFVVLALAAMLAFVYAALPEAPAAEDLSEEVTVLGAAPPVPAADYTFTISGSGWTLTVTPDPAGIDPSMDGSIYEIMDAISANTSGTDVKKLIFDDGGAIVDLEDSNLPLFYGTYIIEGYGVTSEGWSTISTRDEATLYVVGADVINTGQGNAINCVDIGGNVDLRSSATRDGLISASGNDACALLMGMGFGDVYISGSITLSSACGDSNSGTILMWGLGSINIEGGTVENTVGGNAIYNFNDAAINVSGGLVSANGGMAINNAWFGNVTVSGGTVSATEGRAIYCAYDTQGAVRITGGRVSVTSGTAIYIDGSSAVTISGGTVSATSGTAIHDNNTGVIRISGASTTVTSANESATGGTIYLAYNGLSSPALLLVQGGTVSNTSTASGTTAVYNNSKGAVNVFSGTVEGVSAIVNQSTGPVNVSGGTVRATASHGIFNNSTGLVTVSNGIVESPLRAITNYSGGSVTVSGGTVRTTSGTAIYNGSGGPVNVSGGTISATSGTAISNNDAGAVNVSGGTISAESGNGIFNVRTGAVTINRGTVSATSGQAIYNNWTGSVTVYGGTVSATDGTAIWNLWTGNVTIYAGTVSATEGRAIRNCSDGIINVNGGEIGATTGQAIYNDGAGTINISEADPDFPTLVTSANTSATSGTIHLADPDGSLYISGGIAENTADGNIIYPLGPNVHITVPVTVISESADVAKIYDGSSVTLSASFEMPMIFIEAQWYKDNEPVANGNTASIDVTEVADSGVYEFRVKFWGDGAEETIGCGPINVSITPENTAGDDDGDDTGGDESESGGTSAEMVVGIALMVLLGFVTCCILFRKP